ncbi:hypothetical protein ANO11243_035630 [Dothideomycetidae sp. 11243]|nr:hypothetical protein ANO11243_035630 [fungal sp. No.11243]
MGDHIDLLLADSSPPSPFSNAEYDRRLKDLVNQLRRAYSTRTANRIEDAQLLRLLHPANNTLGYIFLLLNISTDRTSDLFLISLVAFLKTFEPVQARYAGPEWRRILEMTGELVHATQNTEILLPYRTAILRMDPTSSTFTSNHLSYVELCLQARRPREALAILDNDVLNFPYDEVQGVDSRRLCEDSKGCDYITTHSGISGEVTTLLVQEYYLLGAQVYIGLREYARATLFLELVLSTPGVGAPLNAFMIEAYKKLVLVSLVSRGQSPNMSRLVTDQSAERTLSQTAKAYEVLSDTFKQRKLEKFHAEVDVAGSLWSDDGNLGLVHEAGEALRRHRVLDLSKTYSALPVERVASHLNTPVERMIQLLQAMIQQGHLQASVSSSSGHAGLQNGTSSSDTSAIIRFHAWDTSKAAPTSPSEEKIQSQMRRIEALANAVRESDRRFALTREYAEWLRRNRKGADAGAAAYEDPMEMDDVGGRGGEDEDIMAA